MAFTYFISDIHLSEDRPDITHCLEQFLLHDAPIADAIYVLGDLFEYWLGDDDDSPFIHRVAIMFKQLQGLNVPVYYVHGNRDFMIGKRFAKRAGLQILPEQSVVDIYGVRTLISHGDELCTRDEKYMAFRKKARGWWWPRMVRCLPLWVRRRIAENGRKESQMNQADLTEEIMDVTPSEVERVIAEHDVTHFVHGHTHRPAIHYVKTNGKDAKRIVLGDWYDQGSVLKVTRNRRWELVQLPMDGTRRIFMDSM